MTGNWPTRIRMMGDTASPIYHPLLFQRVNTSSTSSCYISPLLPLQQTLFEGGWRATPRRNRSIYPNQQQGRLIQPSGWILGPNDHTITQYSRLMWSRFSPHDHKGGGLVVLIPNVCEETLFWCLFQIVFPHALHWLCSLPHWAHGPPFPQTPLTHS